MPLPLPCESVRSQLQCHVYVQCHVYGSEVAARMNAPRKFVPQNHKIRKLSESAESDFLRPSPRKLNSQSGAMKNLILESSCDRLRWFSKLRQGISKGNLRELARPNFPVFFWKKTGNSLMAHRSAIATIFCVDSFLEPTILRLLSICELRQRIGD